MTKHWYAVYTKPEQEQKVTAALIKKGIESFCPLTRVGIYKGFGKKIHLQPLFPSFVFVHITEAQFTTVRQINDVINFMFWLGKPAMVPTAELKSIQQFAATHQHIKVERTAIVRNRMPSTSYEAAGNSFNGIAAAQKTLVQLSLPSLGYRLIAETILPAGIVQYNQKSAPVL